MRGGVLGSLVLEGAKTQTIFGVLLRMGVEQPLLEIELIAEALPAEGMLSTPPDARRAPPPASQADEALLLEAQKRENRFALPNTRFLLHEPRGGVGGQASDVEIQAREIIRMRERLNKIFAEACGQTLERIKKDTDRDYWMSAKEALDYGLVGKIVTSHKEIV